ncbi:HNH endonuclease [Polyangium sp. 15x6]|nr:HNH endonuclease [Polyangium sp. 15x6]
MPQVQAYFLHGEAMRTTGHKDKAVKSYLRFKEVAAMAPKTGVPFDAEGYPDFKAAGVVKREVKITQTGDRREDIKRANQAANYKLTPKDHTWHHHQDGKTMQLVHRDIHGATGHTGGVATQGRP